MDFSDISIMKSIKYLEVNQTKLKNINLALDKCYKSTKMLQGKQCKNVIKRG